MNQKFYIGSWLCHMSVVDTPMKKAFYMQCMQFPTNQIWTIKTDFIIDTNNESMLSPAGLYDAINGVVGNIKTDFQLYMPNARTSPDFALVKKSQYLENLTYELRFTTEIDLLDAMSALNI